MAWALDFISPYPPLPILPAHLPLCLKLLQFSKQSAPFPDPTLPKKSTRNMLEVPRAMSPAPSSTLAAFEFEGLLPIPQTVPPKKSLLLSVFPWLTRIARRHPFLSAVFLYAAITAFVAGVAKSSYGGDRRSVDTKISYEGNGVSFSSGSQPQLGLNRHDIL